MTATAYILFDNNGSIFAFGPFKTEDEGKATYGYKEWKDDKGNIKSNLRKIEDVPLINLKNEFYKLEFMKMYGHIIKLIDPPEDKWVFDNTYINDKIWPRRITSI